MTTLLRAPIRTAGPAWERLSRDLGYSVRRFFVDEFFLEHVPALPAGSRVLDMGGIRENRRGVFDISRYDLRVEFANLAPSAKPDYLCSIDAVPAPDGHFDGVILSEVLEHVTDARAVLREANRLLRPGGRALICAPFTFYYHPNPTDIARYTQEFYRRELEALGCRDVRIYVQGALATTAAGMLKDWAYWQSEQNRPHVRWNRSALRRFALACVRRAFLYESRAARDGDVVFAGYPSGYGIVCEGVGHV